MYRKFVTVSVLGMLTLCMASAGSAAASAAVVQPTPPYRSDSLAVGSSAHGPGNVFEQRYNIYYRLSRTGLDPDYLDNPAALDSLSRHFSNPTRRITGLGIKAWASPEGPYLNNLRLAKGRFETARDYILNDLGASEQLDSSAFSFSYVSENWEGMRIAVEEQYTGTNRDEILRILDLDIPDEQKKDRLKAIDNGVTYSLLIRTVMPRLRTALVTLSWARPESGLAPAAPVTIPLDVPAGGGIIPPAVRPFRERSAEKTVAALKTNLLYDAVTGVNFAIEVPFGGRYSLAYEHICPWWLNKANNICNQYLSMGGEFRWWFRPETRPATETRRVRDALVGHFVGLYAQGGKADIQWKRSLGLYQFEFFSTGLTYGYSFPIARQLNLELSLSVGYARIPFRHYNPSDDWQHLMRDPSDVGVTHYFGPTKAQVSLVIPIITHVKPRK